MHFRPLLVIVIIILAVSTALSAEPVVKSYELDISFEPKSSSMTGLAIVTFNDNDDLSKPISFYLHGELKVDSIRYDKQSIEFSQKPVMYEYEYSLIAKKVSLEIPSNKPIKQLYIYYQGYFHPSRASSPSNYMRIDGTGVYLRAYGYSLWFPLFLESGQNQYEVDFTEVKISTPKEFVTVFTGEHIKDELSGDRRISYWRSLTTGLFDPQCTSQKFAEKSLGDIRIYHWLDSVSTREAESILSYVQKATQYYKDHYRSDSKSDQMHVVEMPKYGEISSGNVTGITFDSWREFETDTYPKRALAHELVHPFVRHKYDNTDPLYTFFIEGFPSYLHFPFLEKELGHDWYIAYMARIEEVYLKHKATGVDWRGRKLPLEKPIDQITAAEIGSYKDYFVLGDRAKLFMHDLRHRMGEQTFTDFCHDLFNREKLDSKAFKETVLKYLPSYEADLNIWLSTNEYPDRFRIK